jgi:predicted DNA-binding transcriptional regulator YafY
MGLYLKRSTYYVWGYCRVRSARRVFRVSRMNILELLPERFERRGLTIEDVDKGRRHLKPPEALEVELCFQPAAKAGFETSSKKSAQP